MKKITPRRKDAKKVGAASAPRRCSRPVPLKIVGCRPTAKARAAVRRFLKAEHERTHVARKIYQEYNDSLKALKEEIGLGTLFQARGGPAYKLVVPRGGYTVYREVDVQTPTIKEIEAAGLVVT